jgi:NAD(P)-dependent dehydrogenase (short-subunit alcohol dehydrogenase family)
MPAALITGGTSGIGLAIARALVEDGYDVTISSRRQEKVQAANEELSVHAVMADISKQEDCERLVAQHSTRFGRIDVLVNSAGIGIGGRYEDLSIKHFDLLVRRKYAGNRDVRTCHYSGKSPRRLSEPEGHLLAFLLAASFQRESRQTSGANAMPRTIRGILLGLGFAALIGSGEAAIANAVTPFERAADTPRGGEP